PITVLTCEARTQLSPVNSAPVASSRRGPNLPISQPWKGDRKPCSRIRIENATWIAGSPAWRDEVKGLVNSAHTYCGLEIEAMQTSPKTSWIQRLAGIVFVVVTLTFL